MDIQKKPTLAEKQTFWAEQLPNFESKYWLPSHFDFLAFDMDQGNYVVKDDLDLIYEEDTNEIFHRVNTGWAMWKKAVNFTVNEAKASVVPCESCSFNSHEIIINETKSELIDSYDIAKEDEYLLESLVYRGVCIGKAQTSVAEGFVLVEKLQLAQLMADMDYMGKKALGSDYVSFADVATVLDEVIEAQELSND